MRSQFTGAVGAIATVASAAFTAISIASVVGLAARPSIARAGMVAVVLVVAVLLGSPSASWRSGAWIGTGIALAGLVAAELVGLNPMLGAGQTGAIVGAVLAIPLLTHLWDFDGHWPVAPFLVAMLGLLVAVALLRAVLDGGGLGHDESAYALKARAWLEGTPDTGWQLHRAPLISALGLPVIAFTENEVAIRLIGVLLAIGAVAALFALGEGVGGVWVGLLAAGTAGASLSFLRRGSEYLTDVPAAGLLILITWIVIRAMRNPESSQGLVLWLGPLIAVAFYMRYQSVLAIVGVALGAILAWPNSVTKLRRPLTIAAGVALLAVLPHLIWATVVTGRPWGIVLVTQDAAGREFLGEGLVDYARMFPAQIAGPAGAVTMAIGLVWLVWSLMGGAPDRADDRRLAFFILTAVVVAVVPLGLVAHGEPRFVFFPAWLLIGVGSLAVVRLVMLVPRKYQLALVAVAVLAWMPLFAETVRRADRNAEARGQTFAVVVESSNAIETEADGSCGVLTTYQPQVNWYSTCFTSGFAPSSDDLGVGRLNGQDKFALLFENGKRQPTGPDAAAYLELGPSRMIPAVNDVIGDATVVSLTSS